MLKARKETMLDDGTMVVIDGLVGDPEDTEVTIVFAKDKNETVYIHENRPKKKLSAIDWHGLMFVVGFVAGVGWVNLYQSTAFALLRGVMLD